MWYFLHKFYGGGPLIAEKEKETPPNAVVVAAVKLRWENLKALFDKLSISVP